MRFWLLSSLLLALAAGATAQSAQARSRISARQAKQIAELVAEHDHIDLNDTYIEMNSLDLMRPFIPGYSSFIFIREATSPGPDTTLRRYAVNRTTGDVWEMTLCRRYDFPALEQTQRALTGGTATPAEISLERRQLGCEAKSGENPL